MFSPNHDISAYEAQRMLDLAEARQFEDQSTMSEPQFQGAVSRRPSYTSPYHPSPLDTAMRLPRNSSDTSLYTPMRRRSLMTPGIATRPSPADPIKRADIQTNSDPPLPSLRSNPPEPAEVGHLSLLSLPHLSFDPSLIPRVETPCETDYKQTGAFRHGTLRITNGSPARTPARETADNGSLRESSPTAVGRGSYFDSRIRVQEGEIEDCDTAPSMTSASKRANESLGRGSAADFLPELKLTSSFSLGEFQLGTPELQTTSRQSAIEDELFEETSPQYGTEVLNVRLDHDAKQLSYPTTGLRDGSQQVISRSDSGVVASPASNAPQKTLSKADSGYSSSISTHSSSTKRNERRGTSHSNYATELSPKSPPLEDANLLGGTLMCSGSGTVSIHNERNQLPSPNGPPPQVPDKDVHVRTHNQILARKPVQHSIKVFENTTARPSPPSAPEPNNTMVGSPVSIGNARQSGKFHRLLSGPRKSLGDHVTHTSNQDVGLPVPRVTQEKAHERYGMAQNLSDNSAYTIDNSKSTAKPTAASRTYQHHGPDPVPWTTQTHRSTSQIDQDKSRVSKSSFHIHAISSTISRAASSVIAKNPLLKKPLLTRAKADDIDVISPVPSTPAATTQHHTENARWHERGSLDVVPGSLSSAGEVERHSALATRESRANSLSVTVSHDTRVYDNARRSSLPSYSEQHATALRQPSGQYPVSRTPPVSLATRNMGHLRVPPPIRPRSTPVRPVAPKISHKSSREGVQSYPPYNHPTNSMYANSSRRSSQESFYNYSAAQIQGHLNQASQMSGALPWSVPAQSIGTTTSNYNPAPSQEPSFDHSRHNSLASQASHRSAVSNGQAWPLYQPNDTPHLKHRSSYDGYSFPLRPTYGLENAPYGAPLPVNGQLYAAGHLGDQPIAQQARQYPQQVRYGSRGHLRHYSLDHNGQPVQYRVLHSYNSPAYRGVPIWSA